MIDTAILDGVMRRVCIEHQMRRWLERRSVDVVPLVFIRVSYRRARAAQQVRAREHAAAAISRSAVTNSTAAALFCAAVLFGAGAQAAAPPGSDPDSAVAHWVHTLKKRSTGLSCCDLSDCRPVSIRPGARNGVEGFFGRKEFGDTAPDAWVPIAQDVIDNTMADGPSPDGHSWACWYMGRVYCAWLGDLY